MPEIGTSGSTSGVGKRSVAEWPKLPRPSSTLPNAKCLGLCMKTASGCAAGKKNRRTTVAATVSRCFRIEFVP